MDAIATTAVLDCAEQHFAALRRTSPCRGGNAVSPQDRRQRRRRIPNLIDDDPCVAPTVMAGLGPATHVFWPTQTRKTWMPGPRPAITVGSMSRLQRAVVYPCSQGAWGFCVPMKWKAPEIR